MTGTGTGTAPGTKIGIPIRTRGTLTRVPAGYARTRDLHYIGGLNIIGVVMSRSL